MQFNLPMINIYYRHRHYWLLYPLGSVKRASGLGEKSSPILCVRRRRVCSSAASCVLCCALCATCAVRDRSSVTAVCHAATVVLSPDSTPVSWRFARGCHGWIKRRRCKPIEERRQTEPSGEQRSTGSAPAVSLSGDGNTL